MKRLRTLPDVLSARQWARRHYPPGSPIDRTWHPDTIRECHRINAEQIAPTPLTPSGVSVFGRCSVPVTLIL